MRVNNAMEDLKEHAGILAVATAVITVGVIFGCLPGEPKIAPEGKRPMGSVELLVDGKEVYVYDAYPLHDDYFRFNVSAHPRVGWDVTRRYYQVDGGPLKDIQRDCVTFYQNLPTDCSWKNPRDGSEHAITLIVYFGMVKTKLDENNMVVRYEDGEIAMDTTEHPIPAKNSFRVHCFR